MIGAAERRWPSPCRAGKASCRDACSGYRARALCLRVAQHDDRAQAELGGDEIVVVRDLAFMRQIDPGRAEDMRHLGGEDRRIGVDRADARGLPAPVRRNRKPGRMTAGWSEPRFFQASARAPARCQKKSKYSFCSHSVGSSGAYRPAFSSHQRVKRPSLVALELEEIVDEQRAELRSRTAPICSSAFERVVEALRQRRMRGGVGVQLLRARDRACLRCRRGRPRSARRNRDKGWRTARPSGFPTVFPDRRRRRARAPSRRDDHRPRSRDRARASSAGIADSR